MNTMVLTPVDVGYIEKEVFDAEGMLKVMPSTFYEKIKVNDLSFFCYKHGFYSLPTLELCEWVKHQIAGRSTIEIGSGHGALGKYLKIPCTDLKLQDGSNSLVNLTYTLTKQPFVKYPNHVAKLEASEAISTYKPEVVVACWVTQIYLNSEPNRIGSMYGVDENNILNNVKTYIHIGNERVHNKKRILQKPHQIYNFPWIYSRSKERELDCIYVWEN